MCYRNWFWVYYGMTHDGNALNGWFLTMNWVNIAIAAINSTLVIVKITLPTTVTQPHDWFTFSITELWLRVMVLFSLKNPVTTSMPSPDLVLFFIITHRVQGGFS